MFVCALRCGWVAKIDTGQNLNKSRSCRLEETCTSLTDDAWTLGRYALGKITFVTLECSWDYRKLAYLHAEKSQQMKQCCEDVLMLCQRVFDLRLRSVVVKVVF